MKNHVSDVAQILVLEVAVAADEVVVGDPVHRTNRKGGPGRPDHGLLDCSVPLLSRTHAQEGQVKSVFESKADKATDEGKLSQGW